ncbi:MAG: hypothetical protein LBG95_01140 [Treponema sp.]|jgi:hypothetical protein|nr:hypothetical protein [Treponema sp.]
MKTNGKLIIVKRAAWNQFIKARDRYRRETEKLHRSLPDLQAVQQRLVNSRSPSYPVETPVVYNSALDDVKEDSEIRLIFVADNPGRREQTAENRRYLVGPSGKIAEKFFRDNPGLNIDFRANVIILNKTPIHTPRTAELKELCRLGGTALETALAGSQRLMAQILLEFQQALSNETALPVWITGYSEMKKGGVFEAYTNELKSIYGGTGFGNALFLYRHFSMNQFTIDLKRQSVKGEPLNEALRRIGAAYREKFLWKAELENNG